MTSFIITSISVVIVIIAIICARIKQLHAGKNDYSEEKYKPIINTNDFQIVQNEEDMKIINTGADLCNDEYLKDFEVVEYISY